MTAIENEREYYIQGIIYGYDQLYVCNIKIKEFVAGMVTLILIVNRKGYLFIISSLYLIFHHPILIAAAFSLNHSYTVYYA